MPRLCADPSQVHILPMPSASQFEVLQKTKQQTASAKIIHHKYEPKTQILYYTYFGFLKKAL